MPSCSLFPWASTNGELLLGLVAAGVCVAGTLGGGGSTEEDSTAGVCVAGALIGRGRMEEIFSVPSCEVLSKSARSSRLESLHMELESDTLRASSSSESTSPLPAAGRHSADMTSCSSWAGGPGEFPGKPPVSMSWGLAPSGGVTVVLCGSDGKI